jgi:hypothetical protein
MRKIAAILIVIVCLGAGAFFIAGKRSDVHHTAERRLWKNRAVVAIATDLEDPDYLRKRFGEVPTPRGEFDTSDPGWITADTIVCKDSSWLAYRAQCHKVDPKVHDVFIAKASDGTWYYSDYHFCIDMLMLEVQPKSLVDFEYRYFMVKFDKGSDEALDPTWTVGEQRESRGEAVPPNGP